MADHMCLPRMGEMIKNRKSIDCYGDEVMLVNSSWWDENVSPRTVQVVWYPGSVWGFQSLFRRHSSGRTFQNWARNKWQGLVPDFRVPGGPGEGAVLADLKFISCNTTRYSRGPRTTIRARGLAYYHTGLLFFFQSISSTLSKALEKTVLLNLATCNF